MGKKTSNVTLPLLLLLILVALTCVPTAAAASSNAPNKNRPSVSRGMAIILVVLIAALIFAVFFTIYMRTHNFGTGETIRRTFSVRRRCIAARGLDATNFPTFTYSEVKDHIGKEGLECAVCLHEFEDTEMLRLIPKCDHVFHPECIDAWLKSHVTCPVCRADLSTVQESEPEVKCKPQQIQETGVSVAENLQQNNHVTIRIENDEKSAQQKEPEGVKRNVSFKVQDQTPRSSFSTKRPPSMFTIASNKFRSHSTGHSLVPPGENLDRYTLRLPENVRKEVMDRALLNRAKSCAVTLPRFSCSRSGYRTGSFKRTERFDQEAKPEGWVLKIAPPFFSRAPSVRSPKVGADGVEGSPSRCMKLAVKRPSFKCLEPKDEDEPGLLTHDSCKSPV